MWPRLAVLALAACGGAPSTPVVAARSIPLAGVDVQRVWIATPTPVGDVAAPASDVPPLQKQRATIGLAMTSPLACDLAKALELREYEGSILGSHGVDVAVTYFLPRLRAEHCQRTETAHEYTVAVDWERRTDTAWTIVVPGYRGTTDKVATAALFAKPLTGHQADAETARVLQAMPKLGEHPIDSMTNAGRITSVKTSRAGTDIVVSVTVQYGNSCEAGTPWRLEPTVWSPDATGLALVFVTLERPVNEQACGDILEFGPRTIATSHARIAAPSGARRISVVIPNVAKAQDLPLFTTEVAL